VHTCDAVCFQKQKISKQKLKYCLTTYATVHTCEREEGGREGAGREEGERERGREEERGRGRAGGSEEGARKGRREEGREEGREREGGQHQVEDMVTVNDVGDSSHVH
jgi:hypothetical protein